jgi:hypothetical protein
MYEEPVMKYLVTRFCCTSGMCITCRAAANGTGRKRIIHADNVSKELADRMVKGWAAYDAKAARMDFEKERATTA